ncbi:MAG: permease-like cell division protein FtsX [Pseudomonadota bacterium]
MSLPLNKIMPQQAHGSFKRFIRSFFIRHFQAFFFTLGQLSKTPLSTLMTSASLGIALALPAGLNELVISVQELGGNFEQINKVSIFLNKQVSEPQAIQLQQQLLAMDEINSVEHISPQLALIEFKNNSGFGDALKSLQNNPLPHVLIIEPSLAVSTTKQIEILLSKLSKIPEVDLAQLDVKWLKRLFSLIEIGKTAILIVSFLLALAVLLIIVNTIRLAIENRRSEIIITKLIGGTNSFIRRPFLYLGFWYGFLGSLVAIFFVDLSLLIIQHPIKQLSELYQSELFTLSIMSISHNLQLIVVGVLLGLLGAWFAVSRQLRHIEPS